MELAAIVMEDFIHILQAAVDFIMIKKCLGNDVAAFAKLSHVTLYARTATDENMSQFFGDHTDIFLSP